MAPSRRSTCHRPPALSARAIHPRDRERQTGRLHVNCRRARSRRGRHQPYPQIVVQNITFENGYDGTDQATCTANAPKCWYGGGAIYVEGGQFKAVNARFLDNRCYAYGPDLGGGAIRALAQYENRPVYITGDTIAGTVMANNRAREGGGAVFDVVDTGSGALTFAQSRLHHNISGEFQTFPGVYYDLDGHDRAPVMIRSTDG